MQREPVAYRVPTAVVAPLALSAVAIGLGFTSSAWTLIAVPFIALGSLCAAPNLNVADGLLAIVAIAVGLILSHFYASIGHPIWLGTIAAWLLSSVEKRIR